MAKSIRTCEVIGFFTHELVTCNNLSLMLTCFFFFSFSHMLHEFMTLSLLPCLAQDESIEEVLFFLF